nr:15200_t:CDS:10 [Entrophospora candida]
MKAIKNLHLDNITNDLRRNLSSVNTRANSDTKHLNKLLTSERGVWNALSTLTLEQNEAAKYLNIWGRSEDVDLADVTDKVATLLVKISEAEGILANKLAQYRAQLKEIRTREDRMKEQRSKKEALWNKIEREERKPKRSDLAEQKLSELHSELSRAESEKETALADFKRQRLRDALTLQLESFYEFGEKLIMITGFCKEIVDQIPMETTTPGEPRAPYYGKDKTTTSFSNCISSLSSWTPPQELYPIVPQRTHAAVPNTTAANASPIFKPQYSESTTNHEANYDDKRLPITPQNLSQDLSQQNMATKLLPQQQIYQPTQESAQQQIPQQVPQQVPQQTAQQVPQQVPQQLLQQTAQQYDGSRLYTPPPSSMQQSPHQHDRSQLYSTPPYSMQQSPHQQQQQQQPLYPSPLTISENNELSLPSSSLINNNNNNLIAKKYFEDPNEADHSDLEQPTDAEKSTSPSVSDYSSSDDNRDSADKLQQTNATQSVVPTNSAATTPQLEQPQYQPQYQPPPQQYQLQPQYQPQPEQQQPQYQQLPPHLQQLQHLQEMPPQQQQLQQLPPHLQQQQQQQLPPPQQQTQTHALRQMNPSSPASSPTQQPSAFINDNSTPSSAATTAANVAPASSITTNTVSSLPIKDDGHYGDNVNLLPIPGSNGSAKHVTFSDILILILTISSSSSEFENFAIPLNTVVFELSSLLLCNILSSSLLVKANSLSITLIV